MSLLSIEALRGGYTFAPSPAEGSSAYERVKKASGLANPDPYTCEVYDHASMVLMTMAYAKATTGQALKDNIRKVCQGGGKAVDNAVDGIKAIMASEKVDYAGASGPCDFDEKGDILDCKFRYEQIKGGKGIVTLALVSHFWPLPDPAKSLKMLQRHEAKRAEFGGELCQRDIAHWPRRSGTSSSRCSTSRPPAGA